MKINLNKSNILKINTSDEDSHINSIITSGLNHKQDRENSENETIISPIPKQRKIFFEQENEENSIRKERVKEKYKLNSRSISNDNINDIVISNINYKTKQKTYKKIRLSKFIYNNINDNEVQEIVSILIQWSF